MEESQVRAIVELEAEGVTYPSFSEIEKQIRKNKVKDWLWEEGIYQHFNLFLKNGYDDLLKIADITLTDLSTEKFQDLSDKEKDYIFSCIDDLKYGPFPDLTHMTFK